VVELNCATTVQVLLQSSCTVVAQLQGANQSLIL
jgi:hypothetical protein